MNNIPGCKVLKGVPASKGIGIGSIFILHDYASLGGGKVPADRPEAELRRYRAARERVLLRFSLAAAHILKELGPGKGNSFLGSIRPVFQSSS